MRGAVITGWGTALPRRVVTNADLEATLDTSDAWITEHTGIKERRVSSTTADLAVEAGQHALERAGLVGAQVDQVLVHAHGLVSIGADRVLLIGAETMSTITDWSDRNTAILFADGAGLAVTDIALFVPHQANVRIIDAACQRLGARRRGRSRSGRLRRPGTARRVRGRHELGERGHPLGAPGLMGPA